MPPCFTGAVRDSLSNLAASLGAGKDKAAGDGFMLVDLDRGQIEAMVRGDWLARKVVDIVPYDMVREWRAWSGHRADVVRVEAAERRLGLRKAVQRALTLGRLYGGGALIIGTGESDPAALARPLDPDVLPRGGVTFLQRGEPLAGERAFDRPRPAEPLVRRGAVLRGRGARARRLAAASVSRGAVPGQPLSRPELHGFGVVRLGVAGALRRDPRRGADGGGCDERSCTRPRSTS